MRRDAQLAAFSAAVPCPSSATKSRQIRRRRQPPPSCRVQFIGGGTWILRCRPERQSPCWMNSAGHQGFGNLRCIQGVSAQQGSNWRQRKPARGHFPPPRNITARTAREAPSESARPPCLMARRQGHAGPWGSTQVRHSGTPTARHRRAADRSSAAAKSRRAAAGGAWHLRPVPAESDSVGRQAPAGALGLGTACPGAGPSARGAVKPCLPRQPPRHRDAQSLLPSRPPLRAGRPGRRARLRPPG
jgi:hypothetical protein